MSKRDDERNERERVRDQQGLARLRQGALKVVAVSDGRYANPNGVAIYFEDIMGLRSLAICLPPLAALELARAITRAADKCMDDDRRVQPGTYDAEVKP